MTDGGWRTVGLAVPGASHVAQGRDGDDAFAAAQLDAVNGEAIVLALADGVGARRFSGGAARLAVHAAIADLRRDAPLPDGPERLVARAGEALVAAQRAVDLTESLTEGDKPAACTLLLAIAAGELLVCLAVGDGAIVHVTEDGAVLMPIGPDPGAAGSANVVSALAAGEPCPTPQVLVIAEAAVKAVAVTSDGLANVSVISSPEGPVIAPSSALDVLVRHVADGGEAESLRNYVATDGPLRARTADDLSLVVAAR